MLPDGLSAGLHPTEARDGRGGPTPRTLKDLGTGYQTFPDTCRFDYAAYLRDASGNDLGPLVKNVTKAQDATVALIGGGIANVIAAHELSRCGVKVTVFEQDATLGGRMKTVQTAAGVPPFELGANRFPAESKLIWHYVRMWATYRCRGKEQSADEILARPFPRPGTAPTRMCYQNRWLQGPGDSPLTTEVFLLWRSFLHGLCFGTGNITYYLSDVQQYCRADPNAEPTLYTRVMLFWRDMRARYEHKSLGEVLQTEVFAARRTEVPNLMRAFAATGGARGGGVDSLFEIGFLEVLRHLVWAPTAEYFVPDADEYTELDLGAAGFVTGLSRRAHDHSREWHAVSYEQMFRLDTPVRRIHVDAGAHPVVVTLGDDSSERFDFAIIGLSTQAMQVLGLDRDLPDGPFSTAQPHSGLSMRACQSIQAAIRQLPMIPMQRLLVLSPRPEEVPGWPKDRDGQAVTSFLTDRYARLTYFLPSRSKRTVGVVDVVGNDALTLQNQSISQRRLTLSKSFDPQDDKSVWPTAHVGGVLRDAPRSQFIDWTTYPGVGGGCKVDRPGDTYLTGSLFFQPQLASAPAHDIPPYARVFLAGDCASFLGGYAEGAAMSALNAVTAVLMQIPKVTGTPWVVRTADLVDPDRAAFGPDWQLMGTYTPDFPRLRGITRVVSCPGGYEAPATWRFDGGSNDGILRVAVSQDGRQMVALGSGRSVSHRKYWGSGVGWGDFQPLEGDLVGVQDVAVSTGADDDEVIAEHPQVLAIAEDGVLLHRLGWDNDDWDPWSPVPWDGHGRGRTSAIRCAIAVEGEETDHAAQVFIVTPANRWLFHSIRFGDTGNWQDFREVPGNKRVNEVAAATAYRLDFTLVAIVDNLQKLWLSMRRGSNGQWDDWQQIEHPKDPDGMPLQAQKLSLIGSPAAGVGQLVVLFSDGNLYHRKVSISQRDAGAWRKVPYPLGTPSEVVDVALGLSVNDRCDPAPSATVWGIAYPPRSVDDDDDPAGRGAG